MPMICPVTKDHGIKSFTVAATNNENPASMIVANSILAAITYYELIYVNAQREKREIDFYGKDQTLFRELVDALMAFGVPDWMIPPFMQSILGEQNLAIFAKTELDPQTGLFSQEKTILAHFLMINPKEAIGIGMGKVDIEPRLKRKFSNQIRKLMRGT